MYFFVVILNGKFYKTGKIKVILRMLNEGF